MYRISSYTLGPNKGYYTNHRKNALVAVFQVAHVDILHLEQDHALEDSKKYQGCRNGSQSSCRTFEITNCADTSK